MSTVVCFNPFVTVVVVLAVLALIALLFSKSFRAFVVGLLVGALSTCAAGLALTGAFVPVAYVVGFIAFWLTAAWAMKSL